MVAKGSVAAVHEHCSDELEKFNMKQNPPDPYQVDRRTGSFVMDNWHECMSTEDSGLVPQQKRVHRALARLDV